MPVDILDVLKNRYAGREPEPTLDLNAMLASGAEIELPPKPEPSFMEYLTSDIKALPETVLTVGSGLVSEALAGWAGLGAGAAMDIARFMAPDTMQVLGAKFPMLGQDSMEFAEDVMDVVRKHGAWQPRNARAQKQVEMLMWPFEKIRESSDYWGKKVADASGRPELGAAVAIAIEGATLFAGPKLAKSGVGISKGSLLRLRRKIGTAARTGDFGDPGLIKAAEDILAEARKDPAMMADIEQYMAEQGAMPPADLSSAYREALLAEEGRLGRTLTQAEVNAVVDAVDQGRLGRAGKQPTPPGEVKPSAPSAPSPIAPPGGLAEPLNTVGGDFATMRAMGSEWGGKTRSPQKLYDAGYSVERVSAMSPLERARIYKGLEAGITPESQAAKYEIAYRGVVEGGAGEAAYKYFDPRTGEYFTANSAEAVGSELEAHRANVTDRVRKYAGVTIEDYGRRVQDWWEGKDVDINQVKEDIRTFIAEKYQFETSGHKMDFVKRGEELLSIINKGIRERGGVPEPKPMVEPIPQSVGAMKAELSDGNISEPKMVKPEDRIAYMKEFNKKRSILKQEQIEAALEEGYDISDMLPDEAQDAYKLYKDAYERSIESSEPRGIGEIYNDMKTLLEGEEGSIYIGEEAGRKLTKLTHEQREALQRLVADAKRMVGDLSDYLRDIGLDEKQVAFIRNQIAQIRKTEPETFGEVRQHWIDSRAIAQGDKIVKQRKPGRGRQALAVYESENAMVQGLPELQKPINPKVGMSNPMRVIEKLDPEGTGLKEVYYDYREAEQLFRREKKQTAVEIKELRKGVSWKSRKRIGAYAVAQQERGANILARMKIKVPELTDAEMRVYNDLRARYEALFERIQTMRQMIGRKPLEKVDNYFTFFRTFNILERAGVKFNPLLDSPEVISKNYNSYSSTPFKFGIERIKKGAMPVELDPFKVFETYSDVALRHLHLSPWVAKMNELLGALPDPKTGKLTWMLRNRRPNTFNFLRSWVDFVAGKPAELSFGPRYDKIFGRLNKNLAFSILAANVRTIGIQGLALVNTIGEIGWRYTGEGIKATLDDVITLNGKNRKFALKHSKVLDGRVYDITIEDAMRGIRGGRIGAMQDFFGRGTLKPMQWSDLETAICTWNGAYKLAVDNRMSFRRAVNFADDVVTRTQASALPGDLAPIQRSAFGKSLTLFQTFTINNWGFLTRDVLGIGNVKISNKVALKKVMRVISAMTLANILLEGWGEWGGAGIQSPFPTPIRDVSESIEEGDPTHVMVRKAAFGLIDPVPVFGSARYGKGPGGPLWELGQETVKSLSGAPMAKPLPEIGGKIAGVPGTTQIGKMIRAHERGETPYGIAIGRYTPSKGGRRKRNPLGGLKGLEELSGL